MKRSLTLEAPTPTNISTNSLPLMLKKGTSASPAMARAKRVFPVPGAPTMSTPFGILPPSVVNFFGSFRKWMISSSSSFASSIPATSSKVTLCWSLERILARLFPKAKAFPPPACTCRMKKIHTAMSRSIGNQEMRMDCQKGDSPGGFADISTPFSLKFLTKSGYSGTKSLNSPPFTYLPETLFP